MREEQHYEHGIEVRRAVLGDEYVEQTLANQTSFNEEFQRFLTRYAWGEVWGDATLSRHTRSLVTVAVLTALNHPDELRLHLRGALRNGVTPEEIKAVLLHCAIYAGVPAANTAFHIAEEVFTEPSGNA